MCPTQQLSSSFVSGGISQANCHTVPPHTVHCHFGLAKSKAIWSWAKILARKSSQYIPHSNFVSGGSSQANCHTVPPHTVQRLDHQMGGRQDFCVDEIWPKFWQKKRHPKMLCASFSLSRVSSFQTLVSLAKMEGWLRRQWRLTKITFLSMFYNCHLRFKLYGTPTIT